jgi:hypothetical protein
MAMAIEGSTLFRAAGVSAFVAITFLIVSGITIALFFGGAGAFWGMVNDIATAIALLSLVLPVIAVQHLARERTGIWLEVVSVAAIAGIALAATGQLLLVLGVIRLETSFVTAGLGILPVFVWLVAVAVLALLAGLLPAHIGWLAIGVILVAIGLGVISGVASGPPIWVASVALLAVLVGWMGSLGLTLLGHGASVA